MTTIINTHIAIFCSKADDIRHIIEGADQSIKGMEISAAAAESAFDTQRDSDWDVCLAANFQGVESIEELNPEKPPAIILCDRSTVDQAIRFTEATYAFSETQIIVLGKGHDLDFAHYGGKIDAILPEPSSKNLMQTLARLTIEGRHNGNGRLVHALCRTRNGPYRNVYNSLTGQNGVVLFVTDRPSDFSQDTRTRLEASCELNFATQEEVTKWTPSELERFDLIIFDERLLNQANARTLTHISMHNSSIAAFNFEASNKAATNDLDTFSLNAYDVFFSFAAKVRRAQLLGAITSNISEDIDSLFTASYYDGLTGLANRRMEELYVATLVEHNAYEGRDIDIALLDLDKFKIVNDTWGHAAGDAVLKAAAEIFRHSVRSSLDAEGEETKRRDPVYEYLLKEYKAIDLAARHGGEEFLIIGFPNSHEATPCILGRAKQALQANPITVPIDEDTYKSALRELNKNGKLKKYSHSYKVTGDLAGTKYQHLKALRRLADNKYEADLNITFSAGIAAMQNVAESPSESLKTALADADTALYKAKEAGRNQIVIFITAVDALTVSATATANDNKRPRKRKARLDRGDLLDHVGRGTDITGQHRSPKSAVAKL